MKIHTRKLLAATLTAATLFASPLAMADTATDEQQFKQAIAAYDHQNYSTAFKALQQLAQQGYAKAQSSLGAMYAEGEGVAQDFKQAAYWWQKAAQQGYAAAQYNLGNMYYKGKGVPQDFKQARYWFQKAAQNQGAEPVDAEARYAAQRNLQQLKQMGQ